MNKRIHSLSVILAVASAAIITACAVPAHAGPSRSFSSPSRSVSVPRVAPKPAVAPTPVAKPAPRVINKTTNNTTVIRETRVVQAAPQQSSGSGWLGNMAASMAGATAGSMIGNWLSRPSEPAPVQQAPVQPQLAPAVEHAVPGCDATIYNCEKKVQK